MGLDIHPRKRASVTITFNTPADAVAWFDTAQERGVIQGEAALFVKDGLDNVVGESGVPSRNQLIVRRASDRPYGQVSVTDETTVSIVQP